jgi:mono/diheme cytochrome c family protein
MAKRGWRRFCAIAGCTLAVQFCAGSGMAKPLNFVLPDDATELADGPGLQIATANCGACHSAEYMRTQPHGAGFGPAFWQAEVTKMINVYKAPIHEADIKAIVDYLSAAYK